MSKVVLFSARVKKGPRGLLVVSKLYIGVETFEVGCCDGKEFLLVPARVVFKSRGQPWLGAYLFN